MKNSSLHTQCTHLVWQTWKCKHAHYQQFCYHEFPDLACDTVMHLPLPLLDLLARRV